jgi:hypothetical protein
MIWFRLPSILRMLLEVLKRVDIDLRAIRKKQEKMEMSFSDLNANVNTLIGLATAAAQAIPATEQAIDDLNTQVVGAIKTLSPDAPISGTTPAVAPVTPVTPPVTPPVMPPPATQPVMPPPVAPPVVDPNAPVTPANTVPPT